MAIQAAKATWYNAAGTTRAKENGTRLNKGYSGGNACSGCEVD